MGAEQGPVAPEGEASRIGVNMAAMTVSRAVSMALALVQSGLIFRALDDVEDVGRYGFAIGYASLFTVFATLGIQRLLMRDIARDATKAWSYVWTAECVVGVLSCLVYALVALSVSVVEYDPVTRQAVLVATAWVVVLWAVQRPLEGLLLAKERMVLLAVVLTVGSALRLGAVFATLHYRETSVAVHGAIAGANLAGLLVCFGFCVWVAGWGRPTLNLRLARQQIRECLPFAVAMIGSLIYFKSDMSVLTFLAGEDAAGIYTPVTRLMEPLLMIAGLWGTTVFPALCRLSHSGSAAYERLQATSLRLALLASTAMATMLVVGANPLMDLLTGDAAGTYRESVVLLQLSCGTIPFFYLNGIVQEFLYASNRNWLIVGSYWAAALASVAGNLLLIPVLGVRAVALVAIGVHLLVSVFFVSAIRRELKLMALPSLAVKCVAGCAVMALAFYLCRGYSPIGALALGGGLWCLSHWALQTLNAEERAILGGVLRKVFALGPAGGDT